MAHHQQLSSVGSIGSVDFDPMTPSSFENSDIPWRKRVPFELVARGVAGVDEIAEYLDDSKVSFGLVSIGIGSGSFKREKSIFIHFNGEEMKPLKRSKANKKKAAAQKLLSPYHAEIVMETKSQCTIDYVFSKLNHIFVSDNAVKGDSKFQIGSLKEEYKKKMAEAKKKVKAEKERLEAQKQRLLEQQEEANKRIEDEKRKAEEEEQRRKEAEEEEARLKAEEEARLQAEADAAAAAEMAETERLRLEQEDADKKAAEEEEEKQKAAEEEEAKKKAAKKKRKIKRKKKDDWSDDREWTGKRIVACIHAQTSPLNWAVFQPSDSDVIPMAFGHGGLNDLRDALKPDQVQYGIMRLTFGEGRFRRSHWIFVCWSPDSMTKVDSQKLRKKRMADRMHNIGYKGFMQKAIGPYGVEVLAEDYAMVTLEDWILRVRRTVVVDGHDDFMNAESFQKALDAEKAHFEERKRKQEEEKKKKLALEKKLRESSEDEEDVYDKDEQAKNRKKRKRKKKGDDDEDAEGDEEGDDDDDDDADKETETETDVDAKTAEDVTSDVLSDVTADEALDEFKEDLPADTTDLTVSMSEANMAKPKRRNTVGPDELKKRDVSSQLCYESITLVKRPDSDLVWVLVEPRLPSKK